MSITLEHNDYIIRVSNVLDLAAELGEYFLYEDPSDAAYATSKHGIQIFQDDKLCCFAIVSAAGGSTTVQEDSALIHDDKVIVACANKVFSLQLPHLTLNWISSPDWATCFSVHLYRDTYIVYGEMGISRLDRRGKILWKYGTPDILVSQDGGLPFQLQDDHIELRDWNGDQYKVSFEGETLEYLPTPKSHPRNFSESSSSKTPWWKFWKL